MGWQSLVSDGRRHGRHHESRISVALTSAEGGLGTGLSNVPFAEMGAGRRVGTRGPGWDGLHLSCVRDIPVLIAPVLCDSWTCSQRGDLVWKFREQNHPEREVPTVTVRKSSWGPAGRNIQF